MKPQFVQRRAARSSIRLVAMSAERSFGEGQAPHPRCVDDLLVSLAVQSDDALIPTCRMRAARSGRFMGFAAGRLGKERESPEPGRTVDLEVTLVEREDPADAFALGDGHERSIRQIHGEIPVLAHQLAHPCAVAGAER